MANSDIILNLVKKYFSLDEASNIRFEENLLHPFVDPVFENLGLEDFRKKIIIPIEQYETFDFGWKLFKRTFETFCYVTHISYEEFNAGLVDGTKLTKRLIDFYELTIPKEALTETMMKIALQRFPKSKELYLVLSLNFADWFLCSTGEKWRSCLDLTSTYQSAFWSGLPGLIIDKNRCMIYITDGETKNYHGIITDRVISRIWGLLGDNNIVSIVKEYPFGIINEKLLEALLGIKIKRIDDNFCSKYPLNFLYNKRDYSVFPYLDKAGMKTIGKTYHIVGSSGNGGLYGYDKKGAPYDGSPYNCEYGLDFLMKEKKEINDFCGEQYSCEECGIGLTEDETYTDNNGNIFCESCFYDYYRYCEVCNEIIDRDKICLKHA